MAFRGASDWSRSCLVELLTERNSVSLELFCVLFCLLGLFVGCSRARQSTRSTFLQAQLVLLKGRTVYWVNKTVLANQDCVYSLCFVAGQSEWLIKQLSSKLHTWNRSESAAETDRRRVSTTPFLIFLSSFWTGRQYRRIESTCWVLTCVAESQFSNVCNVGVVL